MKKLILMSALFVIGSTGLKAQTYRLTHFYLSIHSRPQAYDGKLEITDSFVIFTAYSQTDSTRDSSVSKEPIIRNKKGFIVTKVAGGAMNYEVVPSSDKKEKEVYFVYQTSVPNSGEKKTLYFKAKLFK